MECVTCIMWYTSVSGAHALYAVCMATGRDTVMNTMTTDINIDWVRLGRMVSALDAPFHKSRKQYKNGETSV